MKAKPSKCRVLAAKFFKKNSLQRVIWSPFQDSTNSTFDPQLTIDGSPIKAIGHPEGEQSFTFLGIPEFERHQSEKRSPEQLPG
jgi:hypothetical protein